MRMYACLLRVWEGLRELGTEASFANSNAVLQMKLVSA